MNQLEYDTLKHIVSYCGYTTDVSNIEKPFTMDADGPRHWPDTAYNWGSQPTIAATWNKALAYKIGIAYCNIGRWGDMDVWQGPGANLHRSHFLGRFDDYMSSDGIRGGWMTAMVVAGAESRGALTCVKHGILNDQETDRQGVRTYVSEQAAREGSFKVFQMALQEGGGQMMNSLASVGEIDASNNTALQAMLYDEWGWDGFVVTDGYDGASFYLPIDALIRSYVLPMGHVNALTNTQNQVSGTWYGDGVYTSPSYEGQAYPETKPDDAVLNYNQWYYVRIQAQRLLYRQLYSSISSNGIDQSLLEESGSGMGLHYVIPYEDYYLDIDGNSASLTATQGSSTQIDVSVPVFEEWAAYCVNYSVNVNKGALPEGLTLSEDGIISGTPTEAGIYTFTVQASIDNGRKTSGEMRFTMTVASAWKYDEDLTDDFANAKVGEEFSGYGMISYAPATSSSGGGGGFPGGPGGPGGGGSSSSKYTYKLAEGSVLPEGLTLTEDGLISGTPTESGHFSITVDAWTTETVYSVQFASSYTKDVIASTHTIELYVAPAEGLDGKDGQDGQDGKDGVTPTIEINDDGYWVINGEVTDVKATGENSGCGSSVNAMGGFAVCAMLAGGVVAAALLRKKRNGDK